jgi:hypothetical protein
VDTSGDPGIVAERGEALKLAVLLLLEKLSPTERAAYVLREAFDSSYPQIAGILQMEEANIRQLVSRGRKHIAHRWPTPVSPDEQRRLLEAFVTAAQKGDMAALEGLLAEDVVSYHMAVDLCVRREFQFLVASVWRGSLPLSPHIFWKGVTIAFIETNGQAAVLVSHGGVPVMLGTIDASAQGIDQIMWFLRPSKLVVISKSGQRLSDG